MRCAIVRLSRWLYLHANCDGYVTVSWLCLRDGPAARRLHCTPESYVYLSYTLTNTSLQQNCRFFRRIRFVFIAVEWHAVSTPRDVCNIHTDFLASAPHSARLPGEVCGQRCQASFLLQTFGKSRPMWNVRATFTFPRFSSNCVCLKSSVNVTNPIHCSSQFCVRLHNGDPY